MKLKFSRENLRCDPWAFQKPLVLWYGMTFRVFWKIGALSGNWAQITQIMGRGIYTESNLKCSTIYFTSSEVLRKCSYTSVLGDWEIWEISAIQGNCANNWSLKFIVQNAFFWVTINLLPVLIFWAQTIYE